jgi:putative PIN family toxin of toxin-antitoxin system
MRAILDTNVLLSAVLWRGHPHALLELVRSNSLTLVISPALLTELAGVLQRSKFEAMFARVQSTPAQSLAELRRLSKVVDAPPLAQPVCRDPNDDMVLALALAAQVDLIVSGDNDLLVLHPFEGIPVLSPAEALLFIGPG